jgi:hypothetical protein
MTRVAKRKLASLRSNNATAEFAKYRDDPEGFARDVLGIDPWARQAEILRAVAANDKTAVRSGHKIGKSTSCAILALWWYCTRPRALVVMTSATDEQIGKILWPELQRLHRNGRRRIAGQMNASHRSGFKSPDGRWIFGISTNKTENMGGYSGAELLFIVDEASGVDDAIFNAIEGNRAGGARLIMFGNPTQMSGRFYEAFHDSAEFWHPIHVSSTESPNVVEGRVVIPGLATREYIDEKTKELGGPGNSEWDIRIGGNFPSQGKNSVIGLVLVENANKDWRQPTVEDGPLEIGVDVARYGDDETVIWARRGKFLYEPTVIRSMDGPEVAGAVLELVRELRHRTVKRVGTLTTTGQEIESIELERPLVKIDSIGVGSSPYDVLKRSKEVKTVAVDAGCTADNEEDFFNLRSQLWFALQSWLAEGGKFKHDRMARGELLAPVYGFDARGRKQVESKDQIKKRIHRSPDRADAMALAIYKAPVRKGRTGETYYE